jgi:type I restriction enzyme S subunit
MIDGLKPYAEYGESGVSWLGALPKHWNVRRLRNVSRLLVSNVDKHTREEEQPVRLCNYVDVYKRGRITAGIPFMRASASPEEVSRFRLRLGDVVITKDSESWDDIGVPALVEYEAPDLVCGYHLAILRPRADVVTGAYLFRTLQSRQVSAQLHVLANGVTRYGLSHGAINGVQVPVPSLDEQSAIVRFLDHAERRIRRYIRAKQRLIRLLEEEKQAIIDRAVTRGLDPTVRLKPSGVRWLGSVPGQWEVAPLRRGWTVTDCKHMTVPFVEDGIPLASVREVQSFDVVLSEAKRTTQEWYEKLIEGGRKPRRGDIIYCRNVSVGASAYVATDECFAMGQDVCLIRSAKQDQRYLNYFLHSQAMEHQLALLLVGSTFDRINVSDIKGLVVLVPPLAEQRVIANYLDGALEKVDREIANARSAIALLHEYRTRLIADVVTGKIDVRETTAHLPDEADDLSTLDEADTPVPDDLAPANDLPSAADELPVG